MIRAAPLLPLLLLACSEPPQQGNADEPVAEAPVKDIDEIPVDENAAAAVGEGDDAPAAGE